MKALNVPCPDPQDFDTEEESLEAESKYEEALQTAEMHGKLDAALYVNARKESQLYLNSELPQVVCREMVDAARAHKRVYSKPLRLYFRAYFDELAQQVMTMLEKEI